MTPSRGIHRFAILLLVATFLLLLAGGQVTSTESGDAVPTWPFPLRLPMVGGVLWELGHRQVAGLVAILTTILAGWLFITRNRPGAYPSGTVRLGIFALVLVLAQAGLGGVRVLVGAADQHAGTAQESLAVRAIGITHACVAQLFLLTVVTLAVLTSQGWLRGQRITGSPFRRPAAFAIGATFVQIVLGALLRHAKSDATLILHISGAALVFVLASVVAARVRAGSDSAILQKLALALAVCLLLQVALGLASWLIIDRITVRTPEFRAEALIPSFHLLMGGAILALLQALHLWTGRSHTPSVGRADSSSRSHLSGAAS